MSATADGAHAQDGAPIRGVLFDLDGTLIDTAPDMGDALNELLAEHGQATLPADAIRPHVSNGSSALIRLGFGEPDAPHFAKLLERFLAIYATRLTRSSVPFPGVLELLDALERSHTPWGVVTNKPGWLAMPLLSALGLAPRARSILSGDSLPERKPHPRPLRVAAEQMSVTAAECVYLGDAERDMQAARAAGMRGVVARYGYLGSQDPCERWQADAWVDSAGEFMHWWSARRAAT